MNTKGVTDRAQGKNVSEVIFIDVDETALDKGNSEKHVSLEEKVDEILNVLKGQTVTTGVDIGALQNENKILQLHASESERTITKLTLKVKSLEDEVDALQIYSMKTNLMIYNLPEKDGEDCCMKAIAFMRKILKIPEDFVFSPRNPGGEIRIARAHRLGQKHEKPRPLIFKFVTHRGRDLVLSYSNQLKTTPFAISEQFSTSVREMRLPVQVPTLIEMRKEARIGHTNTKIKLVNDNTLIGNSKVHTEVLEKNSLHSTKSVGGEPICFNNLFRSKTFSMKGSIFQGEAALKRGAEAGELPVDQDLQPEYSPSCKRLRESPPCHHDDSPTRRQQRSSHDEESAEEGHRKCMATQTAFSSFQEKPASPEPTKPSQHSYPSPPPYMSLDTSRIPWQPFLMNPTLPHSSLPGYQSLSPMPSHHTVHQMMPHSNPGGVAAHGDNMPLNLSVSSNHSSTGERGSLHRSDPSEGDSRNSSPGVPERLLHGRPMTTANGTVFYPNTALTSNLAGLEAKTRRRDSQQDMCDPSIEEHFRRSLGSAYSECTGKSTSPSPPASVSPRQPSPQQPSPRNSRSPAGQEPKVNLVSVSGTVDDHFAKALGNQTWNKIKTQAESHSSVDDHFAKALGSETWHQLQARQKLANPQHS